MMTAAEELTKLRPELRFLRIRVQQLERVHLAQKKKADRLAELLRERDKLIAELEKQRDLLTEDIEEMKRQRDVYRGMVYKPNKEKIPQEKKQRSTVGGQRGHKGYGRMLPLHIDQELRVFANYCPDCSSKLSRTNSTVSHTVEDVPGVEQVQTTVTRYTIERQWCKTCKKEVTVSPVGVIPHSKLGSNLIVQLLVWRYSARLPLQTIVFLLQTTYSIQISQAAVVKILKRTKEYFGNKYGEILTQIRAAPMKHADETGWRINGVNSWVWAFLSKDAVYYTIEETRGGGVARKILAASKPTDVLVRDDYAGYKNLSFNHQSCWAHLLRKSHEATREEHASEEMKKLHKTLKDLFALLSEDLTRPFDRKQRKELYQWYADDLRKISTTAYQSTDTKRIQTRVKNQYTNLLTALLYEEVPLTNNAAERVIRPLVVTRKISGGSRSSDGAETHAVNMSILQTIKMKNQPLIPTLHEYILNGALGEK